MSLERIIRPFQSGDVFTARVTIPSLPPSGAQLSDDKCSLSWEGTNPGVYEDIPNDQQILGFQVEWKEDPDKRITETVRIEQEDNPDNYIEVARMKQTTIRNSNTGEAFMMKFANWDKEDGKT